MGPEMACFLDWSGGRPPVETERGEREREGRKMGGMFVDDDDDDDDAGPNG